MGFSSPTKDALVGFIAGKAATISLHTGNCGDTGANEAAGIARQPVVFPPVVAGTGRTQAADVTFAAVPVGTYTHFGLWDAAGAFIEGYELLPAVTLTAASDLVIQPFIDFAKDYSLWGYSDSKGEWVRVGSTTEKGPSTSATELANLRDQISNVATGLLHESPVNSIAADPPTKPLADTYYIVSAVPPPTGAFVGHENSIATWDPKKKWTFTVPEDGETRLVEAENQIYTWAGTKWVKIGSVASKGDTDIHGYPLKATGIVGGDEIPLADVGDGWAKKKIAFVDIEEAVANYISDKSMNLDNKGIDLAKNQLHGTITDFNRALDDGYEFATKDDIADFISTDDAKAYADDGDRELLADVTENIGLAVEELHTQVTQEIEDAIDAIPDVDTTALSDAIAAQQVSTDAKFDDLAAATQLKLDNLQPPDLSPYATTEDTEAELNALQDFMFDLLARHASRRNSAVIADLRTELEEIFNPVAEVVESQPNNKKPGREGKSLKKPTKPWAKAFKDSLRQANSFGDVTPPFSPRVAAIKGCVALTFTHTDDDYYFQSLVFDGKNWGAGRTHSTPIKNTVIGQLGSITINGWYTGANAIADAKAACRNPGEIAFAAAADGIHSYCRNFGALDEKLEAYPTGVTMADMPATVEWVAAPPPPPKPKAATTANAAAWVNFVTDTARVPTGPGTFDTPLPASPTPTKGCVYLSLVDDGTGMQHMMANAYIHDGTNWQAPGGIGFDVPEAPQSATVDTPQVKAWYFGDANAAKTWSWDQGDELTASAEADGIHLFTENERGDTTENVVAYPAGVTMADMPASKTF
jgi:hypothetical protein